MTDSFVPKPPLILTPEQTHDYLQSKYDKLTPEEVGIIERESFNFFTTFGKNLILPPTLFSILKSRGCSMKYIEAKENLEGTLPPSGWI